MVIANGLKRFNCFLTDIPAEQYEENIHLVIYSFIYSFNLKNMKEIFIYSFIHHRFISYYSPSSTGPICFVTLGMSVIYWLIGYTWKINHLKQSLKIRE